MKSILEKINRYHKGLNELSKCCLSESFKEDLLIYKKAYPDFLDCDDIELKGYLFKNMVYNPIRRLFEYMDANRCVSINVSGLGNEYRIDARQVCEYLRLVGSHGRQLLLNSISVKSGVYADLSDGILDNNIEALKRAETTADLTDQYKLISFLCRLVILVGGERCSDPVRKMWNDSIIEYALGEKSLFGINEINYSQKYDELECETKGLLLQYYKSAIRLTDFEKKAISKLLGSISEYKDFFSGVAKLCDPEERGLVKIPKYNALNDLSGDGGDIIKGVRGLSKHLGCSTDFGQKIVNSRLLQKKGILYYQGREIRVKKDKLDSLLASDPEIFKKM